MKVNAIDPNGLFLYISWRFKQFLIFSVVGIVTFSNNKSHWWKGWLHPTFMHEMPELMADPVIPMNTCEPHWWMSRLFFMNICIAWIYCWCCICNEHLWTGIWNICRSTMLEWLLVGNKMWRLSQGFHIQLKTLHQDFIYLA